MGSGVFDAVWPLTPDMERGWSGACFLPGEISDVNTKKTVGSLAALGRAEGTGLHSGVLSHHCARWTLFLALFPA